MSVRGVILRAADGMTVPELAAQMKAKAKEAADDAILAAGKHARVLIANEGARHFVRARRTRKPIRLGAKLGPRTSKQIYVDASPKGFWVIIEKGSKFHRIERRFTGSGRNRRARLLRTPYGPRPYVLHPGHRSIAHPWEQAMMKVRTMPATVFEPSIDKAFKGLFRG